MSTVDDFDYPLKGMHVLLVDDEEDGLFVGEHLLEQVGAARIYTASNGVEALQVLAKNAGKIDLIITDISMPEMNGWDLITRIKLDRRNQHVSIIGLSANALPGDREKAISMGCDNYLTKPLTAERFRKEIVEIISDLQNKNAS